MPLISSVTLLDLEASLAEVERVSAVFEKLGLYSEIGLPVWRLQPALHERPTSAKPPGVGNGPGWIVQLTLGLSLYEFMKAFAGELGKSSAEGVKTLVARLREARCHSVEGSDGLVLVGAPDRTQLVLQSTLPPEAYDRLEEVDWSSCRGGTLQWNGREWHDMKRYMAEHCWVCRLPERREVEVRVLRQGHRLKPATAWLATDRGHDREDLAAAVYVHFNDDHDSRPGGINELEGWPPPSRPLRDWLAERS